MATALLTAGGSVPFIEAEGSPKISAGRDSRKVTRTGYIRWTEISDAVGELFPPPPAMFGSHPTDTYLYAESLEVEPITDEIANWMSVVNGVTVYTSPSDHTHREEAKCTVTYSSMPNPTGTLISIKMSFNGEYQMVSPINMKWQDTDEPITNEDARIGKYVPITEWSFTRQRVKTVPWATIRACMGRVNAGLLNSFPFYNIARETLLMSGAEIGFTYAADGTAQWTLDYRFNERFIAAANVVDSPGGWNHVYREEGDLPHRWVRIVPTVGSATTIQYPTTGLFLTLF